MSKETGGQAFPLVRQTHNDETNEVISATQTEPGMTLRDYFAAKAMVAMMTNEDELNRIRCSYSENKQRIAIAHHAYAIADAMIEARKHE